MIFLMIISILNYIYYFSRIFSKNGFYGFGSFFISNIINIIYGVFSILSISQNLIYKFPELNFILFLGLNLICFTFIYSLLILFLIFVKITNYILKKISLFIITKFKTTKIFISKPFELIVESDIFLNTPIYKNTNLLQKILVLSYLLSIILLVFTIKPIILSNNVSYNDSFKDDLKLYSQVFLVSSLPIIYQIIKKQK